MPNFDSILANYGMERVDGIVLEGDSDKYMSYQYCIVPEVSYSAITENVYGSGYVLAHDESGDCDYGFPQGFHHLSAASDNFRRFLQQIRRGKHDDFREGKRDESGPFTVGYADPGRYRQ